MANNNNNSLTIYNINEEIKVHFNNYMEDTIITTNWNEDLNINKYDWESIEAYIFGEFERVFNDYPCEYFEELVCNIKHNCNYITTIKMLSYTIEYIDENCYDRDEIVNSIEDENFNKIIYTYIYMYAKEQMLYDFLDNARVIHKLHKKKCEKRDVKLYNTLVKFYANIPHQLVEGEIYINIMSYLYPKGTNWSY